MLASAKIDFGRSAIVYSDVETDKSKILIDTKGKAGIYKFTHKESGKIYIGSAVDLSERLRQYYSITRLNRNKKQYISNALLAHGYSSFSLEIVEYIDISNLSKKVARLLILEREQHYLDLIFKEAEPNTYNILKIAGSSLGRIHSEEVRAKIREALSDPIVRTKMSEGKKGALNPMFNKEVTSETRAKMSANIREALSDPEIRAKMSIAVSGAKHPNFGKVASAETKAKMSAAQGTTIFVYDSEGSLVNTFTSARGAGKFLNCSPTTIKKYTISGELFQGKFILSTTAKE